MQLRAKNVHSVNRLFLCADSFNFVDLSELSMTIVVLKMIFIFEESFGAGLRSADRRLHFVQIRWLLRIMMTLHEGVSSV